MMTFDPLKFAAETKRRFDLHEAIGDNTVDNLMDALKRSTAVEVNNFTVALLNANVDKFQYAYRLPQHDQFRQDLRNVLERYRIMDGMEQGDLFVKIESMFKDLFVERYGSLGPEAAELIAVRYAKQMVLFLKENSIQAADLSQDATGKIY